MYDFNQAEKQTEFKLIPENTIAMMTINIRPGGAESGGVIGGWLTRSKSSDAQYFDCEMVVTQGEYVGRKIWQIIMWEGGKLDEKGQSKGGKIGRQLLRAIIESARGIEPSDMSQSAMQRRRIEDFSEVCGMEFVGKIGIEKDKSGQWGDKNKVKLAITCDMDGYIRAAGGVVTTPMAETPKQSTGTATSAMPVPDWAK